MEMYKRWSAGDMKGAVELQKVLAAADPTVAAIGTCKSYHLRCPLPLESAMAIGFALRLVPGRSPLPEAHSSKTPACLYKQFSAFPSSVSTPISLPARGLELKKQLA